MGCAAARRRAAARLAPRASRVEARAPAPDVAAQRKRAQRSTRQFVDVPLPRPVRSPSTCPLSLEALRIRRASVRSPSTCPLSLEALRIRRARKRATRAYASQHCVRSPCCVADSGHRPHHESALIGVLHPSGACTHHDLPASRTARVTNLHASVAGTRPNPARISRRRASVAGARQSPARVSRRRASQPVTHRKPVRVTTLRPLRTCTHQSRRASNPARVRSRRQRARRPSRAAPASTAASGASRRSASSTGECPFPSAPSARDCPPDA